jgi:hypothetical protein
MGHSRQARSTPSNAQGTRDSTRLTVVITTDGPSSCPRWTPTPYSIPAEFRKLRDCAASREPRAIDPVKIRPTVNARTNIRRGALLALLLGFQVLGSAAPTAPREEVVDVFESGAPRARYTVDDEGRKHGAYVAYHENGRIAEKCRYKHGAIVGTFASFHANGKRYVSAVYAKGQLHGDYVERGEDGRPVLTARYQDGHLDGTRELLRDKRVVSRQRFEAGRLLELDGFAPYPRALDAVRLTVAQLEAVPPGEPDPSMAAELPEAQRLPLERRAGLRRLKAYRYLAGVEYVDLALDDTMNFHCQIATRLLALIGGLDHTPDNPGMPEDEYQDAFVGTSRSNLATATSVARSVDMYMDDSDPSNIDRLGHRMHCLNPRLQRTGFGLGQGYSAMWSMDRSRAQAAPIDAVCYPGRGYMPLAYFGERHAWSVTFAKGVVSDSALKDAKVTVHELDELYLPVGEPLALDHFRTFGRTVAFRPAELLLVPGGRFRVTIAFGEGRGARAPFEYLVEFVE